MMINRIFGNHSLQLSSSLRNSVVKDSMNVFQPTNKNPVSNHHRLSSNSVTAKNDKKSSVEIRQNFHVESEALINEQIEKELGMSHVYLAMSSFFGKPSVGLPGFAAYFADSSHEERNHALSLIRYQNTRGGQVQLTDISGPQHSAWATPLEAVTEVLSLEQEANRRLLHLHKMAGEREDAHLCDYLEREFLDEQVETAAELGQLISRLERAGEGLGEIIVDRELADKNSN